MELLHGEGSAQVDYHEMANQLREIADRLDGKGHADHKNHKQHQAVEMHHGGIHGINIFKHADSGEAKKAILEIVTGGGKRFQIRNPGQLHEMIIEVTLDGKPNVHAFHSDHKKILLHRTNDHDAAHHVFGEEIHVDKNHKKHTEEMKILETQGRPKKRSFRRQKSQEPSLIRCEMSSNSFDRSDQIRQRSACDSKRISRPLMTKEIINSFGLPKTTLRDPATRLFGRQLTVPSKR